MVFKPGFEKAKEGKCIGHNKRSGRLNANHIDLNRAFPSWDHVKLSKEQWDAGMKWSEPEVAAMIDWILREAFKD